MQISKSSGSSVEQQLALAAARLSGKGLLQPGDQLSQRIPEENAFVKVSITSEHVPTTFEWTRLSDKIGDLHERIYNARSDVGAIAAGRPIWTSWLSRLDMSMPAIFDEQVRHLGIEAKRVGMSSRQNGPIAALSNGANAYCLDDVVLCFGMGLERLLLNIEILEKCAECFVLAQSARAEVKRIPWLIRFIANGRLRKDQKDAAAHHLRGEQSILKAGY